MYFRVLLPPSTRLWVCVAWCCGGGHVKWCHEVAKTCTDHIVAYLCFPYSFFFSFSFWLLVCCSFCSYHYFCVLFLCPLFVPLFLSFLLSFFPLAHQSDAPVMVGHADSQNPCGCTHAGTLPEGPKASIVYTKLRCQRRGHADSQNPYGCTHTGCLPERPKA